MIRLKFFDIIFEISFILLCFLMLVLIYYGEYVFICCGCAVMVHEICHLFLLLCFGAKPKKIKFNLSGFLIINRELSNLQNFFVLIAGVLGNLLLFFIFFKFKFFALVNLMLAVLNLLPYEKFDGGRLLELILQQKLNFRLSKIILKVCSVVVQVFLFACSLILAVKFCNFTLLIVVCMLVFSS